MSSWGNYSKIMKLVSSDSEEDKDLGYELMMLRMNDLHPDRWRKLYNMHRANTWAWGDGGPDIQIWLYDKRKAERETNKGGNSRKGKRV